MKIKIPIVIYQEIKTGEELVAITKPRQMGMRVPKLYTDKNGVYLVWIKNN